MSLSVFAQSNQTESLTITTYYPSPYGVYRNLEVKKGLAVGGSGYSTVNNLKDGQLFINSSVILNALSDYPPSPWRAGQLIYYVNASKGENTLKYHNGSHWINFTGSSSAPVCGSSNGATLSSIPTTNLCDVGTNSTVNGGSTGPWTWTCVLGAKTTNCIAIPNSLPAICGSSNGATLSAAPTTNLCSAGTNSTVTGTGPWIWTCTSGTNSCPCIANSADIPSAICGSSNGLLFTTKPTTNLCVLPAVASSVSGTGPWLWNCTTSAGSCPCIAGLLTPPVCGPSNGATLKTAPTTNLCSIGTNTPVTGTGPWTWKCQNSAGSVNCQANVCVKLPHYPAKTCGGRTYSDPGHPGCGSWFVANGCTTRETWGASDTCSFQSTCLWTAKLACTLYACTETCTNDWDGTYSCPP